MLKFTYPENREKELLLSLCKDSITGIEAYTFLKIHENIPENSFWCGRDEKGEIKSLVFNNGDEDIKVYGQEFSGLFTFAEHCIMVYEGNSFSENNVREITGKALMDFYKLISESDILSYSDERRYVLRLRAVNKGFAEVIGVFCNEKPVSVAAVSATNEKYALIGDVFTKKEFRNKGLSTLCVRALVSHILSAGKIPVLYCSEEMFEFYKRSGFSYYGKM